MDRVAKEFRCSRIVPVSFDASAAFYKLLYFGLMLLLDLQEKLRDLLLRQ